MVTIVAKAPIQNGQLYACSYLVHVLKKKNNDIRYWLLHMPTTKSTLFMVSKDELDTKEGIGKPIKNALHEQQYGKRHL